jgi:hypothetical protein
MLFKTLEPHPVGLRRGPAHSFTSQLPRYIANIDEGIKFSVVKILAIRYCGSSSTVFVVVLGYIGLVRK